MSYTVTKSSPVLVPPAAPTPSGMLSLSALDPVSSAHVDFMSVFSHGEQPAIQIKEAFAKALIHYYPVAGRIVWTKEDALFEPVVDCTGEGIWFVEAVADCTLADVECFEKPHEKLNEAMLRPRPPAGVDLKNQTFIAQITEFTCGGFCVSIWFNHMIFDGQGAAQFLKAVGEMARDMSEPTVTPVWSRQDIPYPPLNLTGGPIPTFTTYNFTTLVVDISFNCINRIKDLYLTETGKTCTSFDVTTAMIFKSRVKAINLAEKEEVGVTFAASTRRLLHDMLASMKGYYGNCIYGVTGIIKTSEEINNASLIEVITLLKRSKDAFPIQFKDWMNGRLQKDFPMPSYGKLVVSDWRSVGFNEVDYGWGEPKYVLTENDNVGLFGCVIYLKPPVPKEGIRLAMRCVEEDHETEFCRELEKIQMM